MTRIPSKAPNNFGKMKKITLHTDDELDAAIEDAERMFGRSFYMLLYGIDAYMERRGRQAAREMQAKMEAAQRRAARQARKT